MIRGRGIFLREWETYETVACSASILSLTFTPPLFLVDIGCFVINYHPASADLIKQRPETSKSFTPSDLPPDLRTWKSAPPAIGGYSTRGPHDWSGFSRDKFLNMRYSLIVGLTRRSYSQKSNFSPRTERWKAITKLSTYVKLLPRMATNMFGWTQLVSITFPVCWEVLLMCSRYR